MAMLPAYSPMSTPKPLSNKDPYGQTHTSYTDPGLDPKNQFQIRNTPPRGVTAGRKQNTLPKITPPGELMYDTGSGYVPLYQDIGLGGGAQGTFRNMSLSGKPIYSPTEGIQDFSKVMVQANPGSDVPRYSPYYNLSETGQPQVVGSMTSGVPHEQMAGPVYRNTSDANLGTQVNASGESLQDYFFNMMLDRVAPGYGQGGTGGGLDWEAMFSQLQSLTNPSDPDSIETLRRLFGLQ